MTPPGLSHHLRFTLCRPLSDLDTTESLTILLEWALPLLLSSLSVDKLVQVMGLLLVEMKVIVVSKAMPLLSAAILVFSSLIRPLSWAGPLITILPPSIHEYVEVRGCIFNMLILTTSFVAESIGTCSYYLWAGHISQVVYSDKRNSYRRCG